MYGMLNFMVEAPEQRKAREKKEKEKWEAGRPARERQVALEKERRENGLSVCCGARPEYINCGATSGGRPRCPRCGKWLMS